MNIHQQSSTAVDPASSAHSGVACSRTATTASSVAPLHPRPHQNLQATPAPTRRTVSFFVLELSRGSFAVAWTAVIAAHVACAACLAVLTAAHLVLAHPFLSFYAALATSGNSHRLHFVGGVHAALAVLHLGRVVHILWLSWHSRRLVFSSHRASSSSPSTHSTSRVPTLTDLHRGARSPSRSRSRSHYRWLRVLWDLLWHRRRGLFGVESTHFETLFTVRECAEISSLTYQVFRYSEHIAKPTINRLSVAMLVLNCWSVGGAQLVYQRSPGKARIACLVVDFALACGCVLLVPLVILRPYIHALDLSTFRFDYRLVYDDVGFTDLITESRQIFSTTMVDLLAKVVAHLSVWTGLVSVSTLVAPRHRRVDSVADASFSSPMRRRGHNSTIAVAVAPAQSQSQWRSLLRAHESNELVKTRLASTRHKALHTVIALWGLVVVALHTAASHHVVPHSSPSNVAAAELRCKQRLRPWFRSVMTCSVVSLRCDDDGSSGGHGSISADALEPFDADGVRVLLVAHCPALVMPPALARFRNLLGVDVFNSTIVEWSRASGAALSAERHPLAVFVALFMVNMSSVPDGINHDDLPPSLSDVELSFTNITTLPDDVATHWTRMSTLYVEHSQLREIPRPLLTLVASGTFYDLSVHGNAITEIPSALFFCGPSAVELFSLGLSDNPISNLPTEDSTEQRPITIGFLSLQTTLLQSLPDWVLSKTTTIEVNLAGSPMCETPDRVPMAPIVSCSPRERYEDGYYPWRFMLARRQWTPL
ncbi:hypothetical protein PINS_up010747 [Pythium insidiosum]|nr:hypothetical protein PINS_up010747 [Pythium insidiosum]